MEESFQNYPALMSEAESVVNDINSCSSLKSLEDIRVKLLGKKGIIKVLLQSLSTMSIEDRRTKGAEIHALKEKTERSLKEQRNVLEEELFEKKLKEEYVDVTLPVRPEKEGSLHVLYHIINSIENYFHALGFEVVKAPEIDDEFHNFDALNIPSHHPARQCHDTFYIKDKENYLLRTHTSNAQIRTLKKRPPPLRIISIGKVYRKDDFDATHSPMFHQVEGFVVEPGIGINHLKGCLYDFCRFFFEKELDIRFRPSFFPFTEPSLEVDIKFKETSWLEVLGAGMVHPNVFKNCGIHDETLCGFAFGMGVERLAMLKYGISDIRNFFESDIRWLQHYHRYLRV
ncbi:MAG: phenylalanine--tRNA ligase subunit alpha [Alphaproteobacteria bacterium]